MKKYLFFDTETTGLPKNYNAPTTDVDNYPRMIQVGWIMTDDEGKKISESNYIVRPDGFEIPEEAAKINGITTERALREGEALEKVMGLFLADFEQCDAIVGHNVSFDQKIVGAEMVRLGQKDIMTSKQAICTMNGSTNFCKLPPHEGKTGYKWPRLTELYTILFGHAFEGAHDAMADIRATCECFWELKRKGVMED